MKIAALLLAAVLTVEPVKPPEGQVFFAVGPRAAVLVPVQFAQEAGAIITCESKWDSEAVGKAGELGLLQIHPVHFPAMRQRGMNPNDEGDRFLWAVEMWRRSGWGPWSCSRGKE